MKSKTVRFFVMLTAHILIVFCRAVFLEAQTISFIRIMDGEITIPFVPALETFSTPALDNGMVAFSGSTSGYEGLFHSNARSFTKLADTDTAVPETSGKFTSFGDPDFDSLYAAFLAAGSEGSGIYIGFGGPQPARIAAVDDLVPNAQSAFAEFADPAIDYDPMRNEGCVAFRARAADNLQGIYTYCFDASTGTGVMDTVADTATAVPGFPRELFLSFSEPVTDAGMTVFYGYSHYNLSGIYQHSLAGGLQTVADTATPVPGGFGLFSSFGFLFADRPLATADGDTVFQGNGIMGQQGIYARINGRLQVVADLNTAAPGSSGNFSLFEFFPPSISNGNVAFVAYDGPGLPALYARINGSLVRVIGNGDELGGKTVARVTIGSRAFDEKFLAFHAFFSDGTEAVYVAAFGIAEPASADVNGDGTVDREDVRSVLAAFGPCPSTDNCSGDLDGNGVVNSRDLLEVLGNRGPVEDGPPVNDECWTAREVGAGTYGPLFVPFTNAGATASDRISLQATGGPGVVYLDVDCDEGSGLEIYHDVWFRYRPPDTCGKITVSTCGFADFDTRLALYVPNFYESSDCSQMELIACNDDTPGCSLTSEMTYGPYFCTIANPLCTDPEEYLIRVGSKEPDGTGSGQLLIVCEPPLFDPQAGDRPETCNALQNTGPGRFEFPDSLQYTEPKLDETPSCGDGDNVAAWYCFSATQTGVMSAAVREAFGTECTKPPELFTVAVYNDLGTRMIACSANTDPAPLPEITDEGCKSYLNSETVYWGAITGKRYLIRVGSIGQNLGYNIVVKPEHSSSCGWPFTGPCVSSNPTIPGCDDGRCCNRVCAIDPYCCNIAWDDACAARALELCEEATPLCEDGMSDESCYSVHSVPGCGAGECCESVCAIDPFCCDFEWDADCVKLAASVCTPPPCPYVTDHPCSVPSVVAGCDDYKCCGKVCDADPLCCDKDWASQCAALAEILCDD